MNVSVKATRHAGFTMIAQTVSVLTLTEWSTKKLNELRLTSHDRKVLRKRLAWVESKASVAGMTNAQLFHEEAVALRKVLDYEEERMKDGNNEV